MTNDQILQLIGSKEIQIVQLQLLNQQLEFLNQQLQAELDELKGVDVNEADSTNKLGE